MTAVLSLGSNVGDRLAHLRRAVQLLAPEAVPHPEHDGQLSGEPLRSLAIR
jgi:7,8-dihydro-6-hydroxymethylpterin-pyrophosphokinase